MIVQSQGGLVLAFLCGESYCEFGAVFSMTLLGFESLALTIYMSEILGAAGQLKTRARIMILVTLIDLALTFITIQWFDVSTVAGVLACSGLIGAVISMSFVTQLVGPIVPLRFLICSLVAATPLIWGCCTSHLSLRCSCLSSFSPEVSFT